jgi:hypothetical protein
MAESSGAVSPLKTQFGVLAHNNSLQARQP